MLPPRQGKSRGRGLPHPPWCFYRGNGKSAGRENEVPEEKWSLSGVSRNKVEFCASKILGLLLPAKM